MDRASLALRSGALEGWGRLLSDEASHHRIEIQAITRRLTAVCGLYFSPEAYS